MKKKINNIGIIGAGSWGTALAQLCARQSQTVKIWAREIDIVNNINETHKNPSYLSSIDLEPHITATNNLKDMANCDALLLVTPAQHMHNILSQLSKFFHSEVPVVLCSKGFDQQHLKFMSQVAEEFIPSNQIAVLSGPSFALEVANNLPTAVTLACHNVPLRQALIDRIGHKNFRIYTTDDILGAEIGGTIKNILAVVCGIVVGKKLGENAKAAIITRGFSEMQRLGKALNINPITLTGLSGLGDLILTCSSKLSRNFSFGIALGEGHSVEQIITQQKNISEGVFSAKAIKELAQTLNVEMPICCTLSDIIENKINTDDAIHQLLARPFTQEV